MPPNAKLTLLDLPPELHLLILSECSPRTRYSLLLALSHINVCKQALHSNLLKDADKYAFCFPAEHPPINQNVAHNLNWPEQYVQMAASKVRKGWEETREAKERDWALEWAIAKLVSGPTSQLKGWLEWVMAELEEERTTSNFDETSSQHAHGSDVKATSNQPTQNVDGNGNDADDEDEDENEDEDQDEDDAEVPTIQPQGNQVAAGQTAVEIAQAQLQAALAALHSNGAAGADAVAASAVAQAQQNLQVAHQNLQVAHQAQMQADLQAHMQAQGLAIAAQLAAHNNHHLPQVNPAEEEKKCREENGLSAAETLLLLALRYAIYTVANSKDESRVDNIRTISKALGNKMNHHQAAIAITMTSILAILDLTGRGWLRFASYEDVGEWVLGRKMETEEEMDTVRERLYSAFNILIDNGLDVNAENKASFALPARMDFGENMKRPAKWKHWKERQFVMEYTAQWTPKEYGNGEKFWGGQKDWKSESFSYAITCASYYRNPRLIRYLSDKGANINILFDRLADEIPVSACCFLHPDLFPMSPTWRQQPETDTDGLPTALKALIGLTVATLDTLKEAGVFFPTVSEDARCESDADEMDRFMVAADDNWRGPWGTLLRSFKVPPPAYQHPTFRGSWYDTFPSLTAEPLPIPHAWKSYYLKEIATHLLSIGAEPSRDVKFFGDREVHEDDILPAIVKLFKPTTEEEEEDSLRLWLLRKIVSEGHIENRYDKPETLRAHVDEHYGYDHDRTALVVILDELVSQVLDKPLVRRRDTLTKDLLNRRKCAEVEKSEAWKVLELLVERGAATDERVDGFLGIDTGETNYGAVTPIGVARKLEWEALIEELEKGVGRAEVYSD
ncbi:hypothetical protein BJ508DRAFT_416561 [Ascobolus immersus RN42]|uniref:Uncharacterized protein n=1 Tax=Ascobolus immersus RN42 TaxID=1160509 RepID=A0A3N4HXQ8_ASCIM|nr:hypothetical protein BJ508DRAFT_416561 [Ascobolus immersus RN42]